MAGFPMALFGHNHVCPRVETIAGVPVPHVGGSILKTQQNFVTVYGIPVATVKDKALCNGVGQMDEIISGSSVATIAGHRIARMGDQCQHGGVIVQGVAWIKLL